MARRISLANALGLCAFALCALVCRGQSCSQYNTGADPMRSYNLQSCCSTAGSGGGFATSDSFCTAHPGYFVYNNYTSCNSSCPPPTSGSYSASAGVVPVLGWQRGSGTINVCVDGGFTGTLATSLTTGIKNAFTAAGLATNFISNTTDSRCSQTNSYKVTYNAGTNPDSEALTAYPGTKWNFNNTAAYVTQATTVIYMGFNPTGAQVQYIGTHEASTAMGLTTITTQDGGKARLICGFKYQRIHRIRPSTQTTSVRTPPPLSALPRNRAADPRPRRPNLPPFLL